MGYLARYMKEHYVSRRIRRDIYERFISWCGERSINSCLEKALEVLTANTTANIAVNTDLKVSKTQPSTSSQLTQRGAQQSVPLQSRVEHTTPQRRLGTARR